VDSKIQIQAWITKAPDYLALLTNVFERFKGRHVGMVEHPRLLASLDPYLIHGQITPGIQILENDPSIHKL